MHLHLRLGLPGCNGPKEQAALQRAAFGDRCCTAPHTQCARGARAKRTNCLPAPPCFRDDLSQAPAPVPRPAPGLR
jgi:hypothetical protein